MTRLHFSIELVLDTMLENARFECIEPDHRTLEHENQRLSHGSASR